ncbi:MAG TPA: hypothetical protein VNI60_09490 [Pyrinomonadaceae bacterium]|nr:hypothetical protein [Pyrinomonadaceae bacterium]
MKAINLFLILILSLICQPLGRAQDQSVYKVQMLVGSGKNIEAKSAVISLESDRIKIRGSKKPFETKYISFTEIESADYTFSDRPRYTVATLGALAFGVAALPVFFMKTKKNWLTINADKNSAILQLQSDNYRMLLLAMQSKGIKISDSGNRDELEKVQKDTKENSEKEKRQKKN